MTLPEKPIAWRRDTEMWSATAAERAVVAGGYELGVFDIAADKHGPRIIGWKVFTGPRLLHLIAKGHAESFEDAKAAAVAAWHRLLAEKRLRRE